MRTTLRYVAFGLLTVFAILSLTTAAVAQTESPTLTQKIVDADDHGELDMASEAGSHSGSAEAGQSPAPSVRLSLQDAIRFSLETNQEIGVVSYTPKQTQEEVKGANAVYDPVLFSEASYRRDPNLVTSITDIVTEDNGVTRTGVRKPLETGGSLSAYLETRYGDLNNAEFDRVYKNLVAPTIELRQPLLNNLGSKKEKTAIQIANYRASISQEDFRQKVIETVNSVTRAYWKLHLAGGLISVNQKNLDMAEEIYRREAERHSGGISQQLDVQRARSNVLSRRVTLIKSVEEFRVTMDRLKLLMNWRHLRLGSQYEVLPVQSPTTKLVRLEEAGVIETALRHRPDIIKVKQEMMIRESDEKLAAHQRLPTLEAYGRYGVSGYGEDFSGAMDDVSLNEDNIWEVGFNFEWAIGNRSAKSQYRKKKLRRIQAGARLKSLEDETRLEIKQILRRIATAMEEMRSSRLAREAAQKVVEGEFVRFDIGQTSNLELFRAQDLLAVTSRSYLRAVAGYNIALHDLEKAQGLLPEGITIDDAQR